MWKFGWFFGSGIVCFERKERKKISLKENVVKCKFYYIGDDFEW